MKKLSVAAVMVVGALAIAGCAKPPSDNTATPSASSSNTASGKFKACMVSDEGGFDDKSFNQTSNKGLMKAKADLGIETGQIESKNAKDFETNLQSMIDAKCNIIVGVGFMLSDATIAAAKKSNDVRFAIVDDNKPVMTGVVNLKPLVFNTAQSSFLAGYLAAAQTQTGKVGTFGGMNIPTVTVFMDGFAQGVAHYNTTKSKSVQVLGWDPKNPSGGLFVAPPEPFRNVAGGKQAANTLKSQGADILFPVAGGAGEGALQVAAESEGKISVIWVDTDGFESQAKYAKYILSSVYKGMDVAVFEAVKAAKDGSFDSKPFVGTLKNKGTGISPYHDFDSKVSAETKAELDKLKVDIEAGTVVIESASQPK